MGVYVVEIPDWHPTRLNKLNKMHPARAGAAKKQDAETMALYLSLARVPVVAKEREGWVASKPCRTPCKRRIGYTIIDGPKNRTKDADALDKSLYDGLKRQGYLVDDSPKWCEQTKPVFERGPKMKTILTIEDMDDLT